MDYYPVKTCLQELFSRLIPLSRAQNQHLSDFCLALLLAENPHLSKIATHLNHGTRQASRIQWIRRLLDAPYLTPAYVYNPYIQSLLQTCRTPTFHLLIDRTNLVKQTYDLLAINVNFYHRAIPLVWEIIPHGTSGFQQQQALIERSFHLIPRNKAIVFHGDNEFGGVPTMRYVQQLGWDFILAQSASTHYCSTHQNTSQALVTLPVDARHSVYCSNIKLTQRHHYGPVNLFAFYHPVYRRNCAKQRIRYYATSLRITPHLRRVGRRRWAIECYFKDLKSAGWHLPMSHIQHQNRLNSLLTSMNLMYSWLICLGRWLSKTSQRHLIDSSPCPRLSLFRLGWDWLVHTFRRNELCPVLTTLYQ